MLVLRDPAQLEQVEQESLRQWLTQRFVDLSTPEIYDPDCHGEFVVVEGGDTVESLEAATKLPLLTGLFGDAVFGVDDDFAPSFEIIEDHGSFFELVYLFTDDGRRPWSSFPGKMTSTKSCCRFVGPTRSLSSDFVQSRHKRQECRNDLENHLFGGERNTPTPL